MYLWYYFVMKRYQVDQKISAIPKIGRPKKFTSVEELEEQVQGYFNSCFAPMTERQKVCINDYEEEQEKEYDYIDAPVLDSNGDPVYYQFRPITVTGLAVHLDTTRDVLLDYEKKPENADFSPTIKRAKQMIQRYAEEYLFDGKNQTGAIFNLKNNWGWVDRTEQTVDANVKNIDNDAVDDKVNNILG